MSEDDRNLWLGLGAAVAYGLGAWVVVYLIVRALWHAL